MPAGWRRLPGESARGRPDVQQPRGRARFCALGDGGCFGHTLALPVVRRKWCQVISRTRMLLAALSLSTLASVAARAQDVSPDTAEPGSVEEIARDTTE